MSIDSKYFEPLPVMSLDDKIGVTDFAVDAGNPHMSIPDPSLCEVCRDKPCLYICPANNFVQDETGRVVMSWEGCIECGAAILACHELGNKALRWEYPRGGFGVRHRGPIPD